MKKKIKIFTIKKNNQSYIRDIIKQYPGVNSGRKKYYFHYKRVLKNILISKSYNFLLKNKKLYNFGNFKFKENKNLLSIEFFY